MGKNTKNAKQSIPWTAVGVIIALGLVCSLIIIFLKGNTNKKPCWNVTFFNSSSEIMCTMKVPENTPIGAPNIQTVTENSVFLGWDVDVAGISEDTDAYPIIRDVSDEKNAFCMDTFYVEGKDDFKAELKLCGIVQLNKASVIIHYDPDVITYNGFDENASMFCVEEKEVGRLEIHCEFNENQTEPCTIAALNFSAKNVKLMVTDFPIDVKEMYVTSNGADIPTECSIFKGKVFIL